MLFTALLLGALGRAERAAAILAGQVPVGTRWRERVAALCAILGAVVFVASSVRMDATGRDADKAAQEHAVMEEFERIRAITRGKVVLVMRHHVKGTVIVLSGRTVLGYYMAGSVLH